MEKERFRELVEVGLKSDFMKVLLNAGNNDLVRQWVYVGLVYLQSQAAETLNYALRETLLYYEQIQNLKEPEDLLVRGILLDEREQVSSELERLVTALRQIASSEKQLLENAEKLPITWLLQEFAQS